ncbi:NAD-dependent epimerase/dehydratase family protein, partial [Phytophthora palmivora]
MAPTPFEVSDVLAAVNDCTSAAATRRRVFVTGAAGFIGFHTAKALLERGDDVVIVDELNDYYDVKLKQSNLDWLT